MVPGDQLAPEEKCPTSAAPAPEPAAIHPVLLALACCGSSEGLGYFLHRDEGAAQQYRTDRQGQELLANAATTSGDGGLPSDDVEEGAALPALSASSALEGVTPEGDTALHAVARSGDGDNFLRSAGVICRAKDLLFAQNNNGDTPLHCAARAGNSRMVLHLVALARGEDGSRVKAMIEMENKLRETALHEAVRIGNHEIVKMLMEEDPELACFPKGGTSALYIAVLKEDRVIAETMYETCGGNLSYSGPNGQNALHAAALRGPVLTGMLLEWKKSLTAYKDENGSTPLHFAAALPDDTQQTPQDISLHSEKTNSAQRKGRTRLGFSKCQQTSVCWQLLNADPAELYQPDRHGTYPIHAAASVGATGNVTMFVKKYPSGAGLRDSNGRTFLHVAVQKKKTGIADYASRNHSLSWILNMRDNGGNTALHLAVHSESLPIFCALFGNRHVDMNATNKEGQTPLDVSRLKIPPKIYYNQNPEAHIRRVLTMVGARSGTCRHDHFEESYNHLHQALEDRGRDAENVKDTTQNLCIGSVLIATVTFGASFALPGGYISDDHANGGTPTLAGRYAFDAFMMANMLAFICSSVATAGFMFSGASMVNLASRKFHLRSSVYFMATSVTSLTAAFALGMYMVLAPVAHRTAIAMCVLSPSTLLWKNADYWKRWALLPRPFCARKGLYWTLKQFGSLIVVSTLTEFWPLILIFCWAAYARK